MGSFMRADRRGLAVLCAAGLLIAAPASGVAQIAPDAPPPSAAASPPTAGEAAYNLRQIVARYIDWRGPAFGELQTIHERLYLETQAGRQPAALWMDRDGRMRREVDAPGQRTIQAAAPGGGWKADADGKVADDPGAVERARRYALLQFGDAFTGRGGASVALAGTAEMDDHTFSVVRVTFGDADAYDALIDPATGALCCYRITEGGVQRTEMFGDWRLQDGVRLPFAELVQAGGQTGVRVSAVELNRDLDPALFQRPAA
jgi:hypothetical protein